MYLKITLLWGKWVIFQKIKSYLYIHIFYVICQVFFNVENHAFCQDTHPAAQTGADQPVRNCYLLYINISFYSFLFFNLLPIKFAMGWMPLPICCTKAVEPLAIRQGKTFYSLSRLFQFKFLELLNKSFCFKI